MKFSPLFRLWQARVRYWTTRARRGIEGALGKEPGLDAAYHRSVETRAMTLVQSGHDEGVAIGQAADEAMEALLASAPLGVAGALKKDAPRMLAEHRRLNAAFEERIHHRWGSALNLFFMIAVSCQEIGSDGYERSNANRLEEYERALLEAVSGLQARACRQAFEVHSLLTSGFPKGAHARARSMHEAAVVANVLTEFGQMTGHEAIGLRFLMFDHVTNLMDAEEHQRYAGRLDHDPFTDKEMADLRALRKSALDRFPDIDRRLGWAGNLPGLKRRTFGELEALANIDHLRPYYTWASHEVHASPKGVRLNQAEGPDGLVKLSGRTNDGLADPAQGALIALNQVTSSMLTLPGVPTPSAIVGSRAVMVLLDEACDEFAGIERELRHEAV